MNDLNIPTSSNDKQQRRLSDISGAEIKENSSNTSKSPRKHE